MKTKVTLMSLMIGIALSLQAQVAPPGTAGDQNGWTLQQTALISTWQFIPPSN